MIQTKNFYLNTSVPISRSEEPMLDWGYSIDIPANDVYTAGWITAKPDQWGKENTMIMRSDPEYFAPGGVIRSNVLPHINVLDPIYTFDRSKYTYTLF